jgi:accessory gene regulator protein AgrB
MLVTSVVWHFEMLHSYPAKPFVLSAIVQTHAAHQYVERVSSKGCHLGHSPACVVLPHLVLILRTDVVSVLPVVESAIAMTITTEYDSGHDMPHHSTD